MIRPFLFIAFFASIVFLPWWAAMAFGVLLITSTRDYALALAGGLLIDATYGAPIARLSGFAFLYTFVFAALITTDVFLRGRLMD